MAVIFDLMPSPTGSHNWGWASITNNNKASQSYTPSSNQTLATTRIMLRKVNSPTDNVYLKIYEGGSDPESGTLKDTISIAGSSLPSSGNTYTDFVLSSSLTLTSGTTYYFTLTRDTLDDTDKYSWLSGTGGGDAWTFVTSNIPQWNALSPATRFTIQGDDTATAGRKNIMFY